MDELIQKQANYWAKRAAQLNDSRFVSIADPIQKDLEIKFIHSLNFNFGHLLEIGCGNGVMTKYFENYAESVIAIDTSKEMIERAFIDFKFSPRTLVELGDARQLRFPDEHFDTVVFVRVLINMHDRQAQRCALDEAYRVLKPGGHMILIEGSEESFEAINRFRTMLDLPPIHQSPVNFYLNEEFFANVVEHRFKLLAKVNSGVYDFMTRVMFSGNDDTQIDSSVLEIKSKLSKLLTYFNDDLRMNECSRLKGGLYQKILIM